MISKISKYLYLVGFLSIFNLANAADIPDPIQFDDSDLNPSENVRFLLYTHQNRDEPQQQYVDDADTLSKSNYDISKPTKFMTHGWNESGNSECATPVWKGFLVHDFNVIVVDWSKIASMGYLDAAKNVQGIAKYIAKMVDFLIDQGTNVNELTIAGHSLGGHIAGLTAFFSKNDIPHVVAMDPAQPGFRKQRKDGRLIAGDAKHVETIHTDGAALGFSIPIGDIDYFPNGGQTQPGCGDDKTCSHVRACLFYGEALSRPSKWFARRCRSDKEFNDGECNDNLVIPFARWTYKTNRPTGTYYLRTNAEAPFGLGKDGVSP